MQLAQLQLSPGPGPGPGQSPGPGPGSGPGPGHAEDYSIAKGNWTNAPSLQYLLRRTVSPSHCILHLQLRWSAALFVDPSCFNLLNDCKAINRENPGTQNTPPAKMGLPHENI